MSEWQFFICCRHGWRAYGRPCPACAAGGCPLCSSQIAPAQGMSARESRDPQGLGPQAASPVAESDAPDNSLPSHNQERI